MERNMQEDKNDLIDLGAASTLTLGIPETNAFEDLNGDDYKE